MCAPDALGKIAEINPKISTLYFCAYEPKYNLKEESEHKPTSMFRLLHHSPSRKDYKLKRGEITGDKIWSMIGLLKKDSVLAVLSEVWAGKKRLHIPMMDFDCDENDGNLAKIECFLRAIGQQGIILESGRSYHFYGIKLMNGKQWLNFLGDCQLFGLCDRRYIGHRLKDGLGILRVSCCDLRQQMPRVVTVVDGKIPDDRTVMATGD